MSSKNIRASVLQLRSEEHFSYNVESEHGAEGRKKFSRHCRFGKHGSVS